jgi:hypothetical protein
MNMAGVSTEAGPAPGNAGRGQGLSMISTKRGVGGGGGKGLSILSAAKNAPGKSNKKGLSAVSTTPGKGKGPSA